MLVPSRFVRPTVSGLRTPEVKALRSVRGILLLKFDDDAHAERNTGPPWNHHRLGNVRFPYLVDGGERVGAGTVRRDVKKPLRAIVPPDQRVCDRGAVGVLAPQVIAGRLRLAFSGRVPGQFNDGRSGSSRWSSSEGEKNKE